MTTQKLNGLEHARRWMDSLGMRHYGEVDAAIAKAGAGASGYSEARHTDIAPELPKYCPPPWGEMGFAAYASGALEEQRCVGNDFNRLFDNTDSTAASPCIKTEEKVAWNEALRAAKELVNGTPPNSFGITSVNGVNVKTDLGSTDSFLTTLEVRVNPVAGDAKTHPRSFDLTCNSTRSFAIHLWI